MYLPAAIAVAEQRVRGMRVRPDAAHLFINVLAKVGYVEDATPIVEARIKQVFSKIFEHGKRDLPFVCVHSELHCDQHFNRL
jgi:hypothetical protein